MADDTVYNFLGVVGNVKDLMVVGNQISAATSFYGFFVKQLKAIFIVHDEEEENVEKKGYLVQTVKRITINLRKNDKKYGTRKTEDEEITYTKIDPDKTYRCTVPAPVGSKIKLVKIFANANSLISFISSAHIENKIFIKLCDNAIIQSFPDVSGRLCLKMDEGCIFSGIDHSTAISRKHCFVNKLFIKVNGDGGILQNLVVMRKLELFKLTDQFDFLNVQFPSDCKVVLNEQCKDYADNIEEKLSKCELTDEELAALKKEYSIPEFDHKYGQILTDEEAGSASTDMDIVEDITSILKPNNPYKKLYIDDEWIDTYLDKNTPKSELYQMMMDEYVD